MDSGRMMWLAAVAAAVSAAVAAATVCFMVPLVVGQRAVIGNSEDQQRGTTRPTAQSPASSSAPAVADAGPDETPPTPAEIEQDREAVAAIKSSLNIDLFSGTLLDDADHQPDAAESAGAEATDDQIAVDTQTTVDALMATADQLEEGGQAEAAKLVRSAAKRLRERAPQAAAIERRLPTR